MMAEALLEYETIDRHQIDEIMSGRKPSPPKDWDGPTGKPTAGSQSASPAHANDDAAPRAGDALGGPASEH